MNLPFQAECATTAQSLCDAVLRALDYRGDVTIETRDGRVIVGYLFDASLEPADRATLRLLPSDGSPRIALPLAEVSNIACTGRDTASGRSWESWLKRSAAKRAANESANIESEPLDAPSGLA